MASFRAEYRHPVPPTSGAFLQDMVDYPAFSCWFPQDPFSGSIDLGYWTKRSTSQVERYGPYTGPRNTDRTIIKRDPYTAVKYENTARINVPENGMSRSNNTGRLRP